MRVEPVNDTPERFFRSLAEAFRDERYHPIERVTDGFRKVIPVRSLFCSVCAPVCRVPQACRLPEPVPAGLGVLQRLFRHG